MEVCTCVTCFEITSAFEMVRVGVVDFLLVLVKDLKLYEIDTLLE